MNDTTVLQFSQPVAFADPLTEVLRSGARALLTQAVEAEVATLLARYADELGADGRRRLVRHGHQPRARDHDRHRSGCGALPAGARPG